MLLIVLFVVLGSAAFGTASDQWQPASGPLMTRWAARRHARPCAARYPRPQMVRHDWLNLNGLWDYAIRPRAESAPATFDGRILVPFPIESALSGVMKKVGEANRLWYRRTFEVPRGVARASGRCCTSAPSTGTRLSGSTASDVGTHRGGYDEIHVRHHGRADAVRVARSRRVRLGSDRRRHAAARQASQQPAAASGTRRSPASGRRCGSSRCRDVAIDSLDDRARHRREPRDGHAIPKY